MSNVQRIAAALLLPLLVLIQGCDRLKAEPEPATLIVDLTAVARAIGKDDEINTTLNDAREQLNTRLKLLVNTLNTELDSAKEKLGKTPAKDAQASYTQLAGKAATRLQQSRQVAQLRLNNMQNNLLVAFRDRVRDVASEIAHKRGAPLVQIAGADLLWFDPEADITDEVIAHLRAQTGTNSGNTPSSPEPVDPTTRREAEKLNKLVEKVESN